jgi:hypothetical protein
MSATINTDEFEWADVHVTIEGEDIEGLLGAEYSGKQDKELSYGRGNEPRSIQKGNKSYEGKLKLTQSSAKKMLELTGKKNMMEIGYTDINVSYVREEGGMMEKDVLKNAQFTEHPKGINQGDKKMEIEIPFIFLKLE